MNPEEKESLDELLKWYKQRYTRQMVEGSNIALERMKHNLAVLEDAAMSYRAWRKYGA